MSSPSGVCNADVRVKFHRHIYAGLIDKLLQFLHLADLFECIDLVFFVAVHSKTSGVVATVFQSGQSCGMIC